MAIKLDFYYDIFENEQKWINYIQGNLLNVVYLKDTLFPFYLEKKKVLEEELLITNSRIIKEYITIVDNILNQIKIEYVKHNNREMENIHNLLPLFLSTQMCNIQNPIKNKKI